VEGGISIQPSAFRKMGALEILIFFFEKHEKPVTIVINYGKLKKIYKW